MIAKITDANEIAKARLFPYQVWAAYKNAPSDNWRRALGRTLERTIANIPELDGTLVVIDTSGSMQAMVSGRSTMAGVERRRRHLRPDQRARAQAGRHVGARRRRKGSCGRSVQ